MIQRLCSRCHSVLHLEDESTLVFCPHCGAPRVLLSEELRNHAEAQSAKEAGAEETSPPLLSSPDPTAVVWRKIIQLSALVALIFSLLSMFLPPLALLAPAIVLSLYLPRHRQTLVNTALGARVGLICGLFTGLGISILSVAGMLISRFGTAQMDEFDQSITAMILRVKSQVVAQQGPAAAELFNRFTIPEFRAGLVMGGLGMFLSVLVVLSVAGGALAGFVRARTLGR